MSDLRSQTFLCIDCEMTGLDPENDRIIEVGAIKFTLKETLSQFESLINPDIPVSLEALAIHNISNEMLEDKPKIEEVLPKLLEFIGKDPLPLVGHGIGYDIELIERAAKKLSLSVNLSQRPMIDTLRLARYYGDSPSNSLKMLAMHFNIPIDETHRAMADVRLNIEVFKHLTKKFHTLDEVLNLLAKPIKMKAMPLGKYKGRSFSEIPIDYLQRSLNMNFDKDLHFSILQEIKRRKKGDDFFQASNPFQEL